MGYNRHLTRPLSWFLAKLRSRDTLAVEALRKYSAERSLRPAQPALLSGGEELRWTAR